MSSSLDYHLSEMVVAASEASPEEFVRVHAGALRMALRDLDAATARAERAEAERDAALQRKDEVIAAIEKLDERLAALLADNRRLDAVIERVRELHVHERGRNPLGKWYDVCSVCGFVDEWPCPTIAALDSTDPVEATGPDREREIREHIAARRLRPNATLAEIIEHEWELAEAQVHRSLRQAPTSSVMAHPSGDAMRWQPADGTHPDVPAPGRPEDSPLFCRACAMLEGCPEHDPHLGDEETDLPEPCQPIGCDNGIHLPGCWYAAVDGETT